MTPSHIKLLEDADNFIPKLLSRLFQAAKEGQEVDVLAAVVDRIPYPTYDQTATRDQTTSETIPLAESKIDDGSKGLSFIVLDAGEATPDLWSGRGQPKVRETITTQDCSTLSFAFPPFRQSLSMAVDGKEEYCDWISRTLQLPVANTVFHNGKRATLVAQRWIVEERLGAPNTFSCVQESSLPQQVLHMPSVFSFPSKAFEENMFSHLIPITPARTISAAAGNIIRRISEENPRDGDAPASEELEETISGAIRAGSIPAEQVGVWALVKDSNFPPPTQDKEEAVTGAQEMQKAILNGSRLHKVLSGGGGWDEKRGLLALDPDSDYNSDPDGLDEVYNTDVELGKLQGLRAIVKAGDLVRFYINRPPCMSGSYENLLGIRKTKETPSLLMEFGSLPSTADLMPGSPGTQPGASNCIMIKDHFGMLSERGMSLQVSIHYKEW